VAVPAANGNTIITSFISLDIYSATALFLTRLYFCY
jgi:hypothetical protein